MIPVFDITRQNKLLKKELDQAVGSVIDKGIFVLGPNVSEFEKELAKYVGVKYAVGVASGTDAISLALLALGVGQGDEVIIPANAYPSVFAVTAIGATPKLVDIDPGTFNINPAKISQAVTRKTKAILPVHLSGQPADMEKISAIGKKYKIPVVEDCAQAVGAQVLFAGPAPSFTLQPRDKRSFTLSIAKGLRHPTFKKVGSIGDAGCFSFYPTKNLGAFGDGGMVVTNNKEIYEKVRLLRMYGEKSRYDSVILGRNSRLDELQAAILLTKLKYVDKWNKRRRQIAQLYLSLCANFSNSKANIILPVEASYAKHVYHLFVIRTKKRDELRAYLEKKGIQTAIHYPVPIHLVPSMKYLGYKKGDFPQSEKACKEILSLPIFPELTDNEIETIFYSIDQFFS